MPAGNVQAGDLDANFSAAAPLDSPVFTGTPAGPTPTAGDATTKLATTQFVQTALLNATGLATRQTVIAGPLSAAGLPTFLPATSGSLNLSTQNLTGSTPLVATSGTGWSATTGLQVNQLGLSTANLTWTGLTNGSTNYLYVTITSGVLTTGFTTLVPIYQWGAAPAVTNNQFTFNISQMQGFMGNGATAPASNIVFVGEAVASAGTITSTVAYAYNGLYDSGFIATLPGAGTFTSKNSNLGVIPDLLLFQVQNITNEAGFVTGDTTTLIQVNNGSAVTPVQPTATRNTVGFTSGSSTAFDGNNKTTGGFFTLTGANWSYRVMAKRGW